MLTVGRHYLAAANYLPRVNKAKQRSIAKRLILSAAENKGQFSEKFKQAFNRVSTICQNVQEGCTA
jgi:hypothetical protein